MKILVVGNNSIHLMYMMPIVESLISITHGQSLYCCTTSSIGSEYNRWVSDNSIKEFISKDIIITGKHYKWDAEIFRIINNYNPDSIFWWNGIVVGRNIINEVKTHRKVIFCEVGFFPQREHCYLDTKGINYLSSIRERKSPDISDEQRKRLRDKISKYKQITLINDDRFILKDYIFVPLQLENDSQITNFSKRFKKMDELVDFVSKTFFNEKIVIRPHPLDKQNYSSRWNNVEVAKDVNTHLLIKNSKWVVGINSTVLLESLLYDKTVGAFGEGIFTGKNILLEAHDDIQKIRSIDAFIVDIKAKNNFLYDLIFNYQIKIGDINSNNIVEKYSVNPEDVMNWFHKNISLDVRRNNVNFSYFEILLCGAKNYIKNNFRYLKSIKIKKIYRRLKNLFGIKFKAVWRLKKQRLKWFIAQKGEKKWWENWLKENPDSNDNKWLNTVLRYFELKQNQDFGNKVLVDIGSGPIGILTKLKAKEKIAVDPLPIESADKTIKRIKGPGEEIPLLDETADCVFIYNVLQHVVSLEKVLEEGIRILKRGGTFYSLEQLNLPTNKLHPHSLKLKMFEEWIRKNNFEIVKKIKEDDCYFDHPSVPNSGYSILCLILKKKD